MTLGESRRLFFRPFLAKEEFPKMIAKVLQ